jgi:hypothetical protein
MIRSLFQGPKSINDLVQSEKLNPTAVINIIQGARSMGYKIVAHPGPPTTFTFEPPT